MKTRHLIALLLTAAVSFGCGQSNTGSSPYAPGNSLQQAQTGTVTFTVQFPPAALNKALLDNRTAKIHLNWAGADNIYGNGVYLIPNPTTGVATTTLQIPTGYCQFKAVAIHVDANQVETPFDETGSAGEIVAGSNTVYLTFLTGDWQLVDNNDDPLPLTLSATSGPVTLDGFSLKNPFYNQPTAARVDRSKPVAWTHYSLQWYVPGAPPVMFGPPQEGELAAQFYGGTTNESGFSANNDLNLDDPYAPPGAGSRVFFIDAFGPDSSSTLTDQNNTDLKPIITPLIDTWLRDGNHIAGTMIELTNDSNPPQLLGTSPLTTTCEEYYATAGAAKASRAATIKAAVAEKAGAQKAAPGEVLYSYSGTVTHTYNDCWPSTTPAPTGGYLGELRQYSEQISNVIIREFRAKGSQHGTVYAPPSDAQLAVEAAYAFKTAIFNADITKLTTLLSDSNFLDGGFSKQGLITECQTPGHFCQELVSLGASFTPLDAYVQPGPVADTYLVQVKGNVTIGSGSQVWDEMADFISPLLVSKQADGSFVVNGDQRRVSVSSNLMIRETQNYIDSASNTLVDIPYYNVEHWFDAKSPSFVMTSAVFTAPYLAQPFDVFTAPQWKYVDPSGQSFDAYPTISDPTGTPGTLTIGYSDAATETYTLRAEAVTEKVYPSITGIATNPDGSLTISWNDIGGLVKNGATIGTANDMNIQDSVTGEEVYAFSGFAAPAQNSITITPGVDFTGLVSGRLYRFSVEYCDNASRCYEGNKYFVAPTNSASVIIQ